MSTIVSTIGGDYGSGVSVGRDDWCSVVSDNWSSGVGGDSWSNYFMTNHGVRYGNVTVLILGLSYGVGLLNNGKLCGANIDLGEQGSAQKSRGGGGDSQEGREYDLKNNNKN